MNYRHDTEITIECGSFYLGLDVRIDYSVTFGSPARIRYDENDSPADPDEIDILKVQTRTDSAALWSTHSVRLYGLLDEILDSDEMREELIEAAKDEEIGRQDGAADYAYEAARDRGLV
jgi:hypothetical protein